MTRPDAVDVQAGDALHAAFGATPQVPVQMGRGPSPRTRWLAAVALGGHGRYAAATVLQELLRDPRVPGGIAAHAAVTPAAHRRQLAATAPPGASTRSACGSPSPRLPPPLTPRAPIPRRPASTHWSGSPPTRRSGAPDVARRLLGGVAALADDHPSWRSPIRIGWVRAELALLEGRPGEAVELQQPPWPEQPGPCGTS